MSSLGIIAKWLNEKGMRYRSGHGHIRFGSIVIAQEGDMIFLEYDYDRDYASIRLDPASPSFFDDIEEFISENYRITFHKEPC